jgi:hypothetical protein
MGNSKSTPKMEIESDGEMAQIVNLLAEEERWIQAIFVFLTFGVMKYVVVPYLQDLNDSRRAYISPNVKLLKIKQSLQPLKTNEEILLHKLPLKIHQPTICNGKGNFLKFKILFFLINFLFVFYSNNGVAGGSVNPPSAPI